MKSLQVRPFVLLVSVVLCSMYTGSVAMAADQGAEKAQKDQASTQLETITVRSKFIKRARPANVSGLGLTQKNANVI